jgi:S-adenosylmethionine:tRNA ribosyltransferase-isomerase
MDRAAFRYELPPELIAQAPLAERSASRLLVLDAQSGALEDRRFVDLPPLLAPGDLLVLNDTRVLPARLHGTKETGGRVELLLERVIDARSAWFQVKASKSPKPGSEINLPGDATARVVAREGDLFALELDRDVEGFLEAHGEIPLPPYIERAPEARDAVRYQTVFAAAPGAVAAPTAGLHFDASVLAALEARGIGRAFVTLHVGAGTFTPLRSNDIDEHVLHPERMRVGSATCATVEAARQRGNRIVAVGTTAVRALETAAAGGALEPYEGDTRLYVRPGFEFRVVDTLLTNFHLPESSLLVLVAAFAGLEATLAAYRHAVRERYRFFSYGDAMLILNGGRLRPDGSGGAAPGGRHAL